MKKRIMTLFARTPVHLGAGNSVGVVDSPVMRERHTKIPIIPGSSLKGVLADLWSDELEDGKRKKDGVAIKLFGGDDDKAASAGRLLVGESRVLAFPVRSGKGAFAWITCPLALERFKRDSGVDIEIPDAIGEDDCLATEGVTLENKVVLEEYVFKRTQETPSDIIGEFKDLHDDEVWRSVGDRLVIVSDEIFSYFCENACEIVSRIKIDDKTGVVAKGALFNQEQTPSETMFYSVIGAQDDKNGLSADEALAVLTKKLETRGNVIQVGGDETIGLGYCGVNFPEGGEK